MRDLTSILIKYVMNSVILYLVLGLGYGISLFNIMWMGAILTALAYVIGDLWVLPAFGNLIATAADLALAYVGVWAMGYYFLGPVIDWPMAALYSAVGIAIGEYFFHKYLPGRVIESKEK